MTEEDAPASIVMFRAHLSTHPFSVLPRPTPHTSCPTPHASPLAAASSWAPGRRSRCRMGQRRRWLTARWAWITGLLVRMDHCTGPDPPADPGGPTHVHHDPARPPQVVSSTDAVVGRASLGALPSAATAIVASGAGTTLRVVGCRLEGGAENGVGVQRGASADLQDCVLGLSAEGRACSVYQTGSSAVLRGCRIEGSPPGAGRRKAAELPPGAEMPVKPALHALRGGSLVLDSCEVDVDGVMSAVGASDPGADGGHNLQGLQVAVVSSPIHRSVNIGLAAEASRSAS
jgi:hypothetical protein